MKLLFDENLSPFLPEILADVFPESMHVRDVSLTSAPDTAIWTYAASHGFVIVTKDDDFNQLAVLHGPPPQIIWITFGNCTTSLIAAALRSNLTSLIAFAGDPSRSLISIDLD